LARLVESRPGWTAGLLNRVRSEAFAKVVLVREADFEGREGAESWYRQNLGLELIGAVREHYRLAARTEGYFIYVPKGLPGP
jgi:hypothetical protein